MQNPFSQKFAELTFPETCRIHVPRNKSIFPINFAYIVVQFSPQKSEHVFFLLKKIVSGCPGVRARGDLPPWSPAERWRARAGDLLYRPLRGLVPEGRHEDAHLRRAAAGGERRGGDKQTDRQANKHVNKQTDRQANKHVKKQTDRQTDRQISM